MLQNKMQQRGQNLENLVRHPVKTESSNRKCVSPITNRRKQRYQTC